MARRLSGIAFASTFGLVSVFSTAASAAGPDLMPIPSELLNEGTVSVRNAGDAPAGASVAIFKCLKVGHVGSGGGCPPLPPHPEYTDPAFPDQIAVKVPPLGPNQVYNTQLSFYKAIKWPPGNYEFTLTVDAGNALAETNENNNTGRVMKVVP